MNYLIVVYIIGLIFCITARAVDIKLNYMKDQGDAFFTLMLIISPLSMPITFLIGLIVLIGFVLNFISHKISDLIK